MTDNTTVTDQIPVLRTRPPSPGMVLVWAAKKACCRAIAFNGRTLVIGREASCDIVADENDDAASRRHAEVSIVGDHLVVRDLGSKNGTFVNGVRVTAAQSFPLPSIVRVGSSVFVARADVGDFVDRSTLYRGDSVIGPDMEKVWDQIVAAAKAERTLIIHGESGTGKERAAKLVHEQGPRVRGPWVAVNCALIDRDRAIYELFGWKKGAYTGAIRDGAGLFLEAHGGVLFLDEIAELELGVQAKLLRVLMDGIIKPAGGTERKVDVHVVCASHAHLPTLVAEGRFREDLWARIAQREVTLPPLRSRLEDIPFLIEHFLDHFGATTKPSVRFIEACLVHPWRRNVRELEITCERLAQHPVDGLIEPDDSFGRASIAPTSAPASIPVAASSTTPSSVPKGRVELRDETILAAYAAHGGDANATAAALGIARSTVYKARDRARSRST